MAEFDGVLFADLRDAAMFELRNKSFYPNSHPAQPSDVRPAEWTSPPVSVRYCAIGYGAIQAGQFVFRGWLIDLSLNQAVFGAT